MPYLTNGSDMVPRVAKSGASFKGAGLYYLHDKGAMTADRVAFTETVNLPTNNADRALAQMIDTSENADKLKRQAGIKGGRKLQKPVYAYSLAWHPTEAPTKAEQVEAARETLAVLGLEKNQALIVAHTDTDHPHVHVIVNRVDPETGRAVTMSHDRLKLSQWAEAYEKKRGTIFCDQRIANNDNRRQTFVKDRSERYAWKKQESDKIWRQYREDKARQIEANRARYNRIWERRQATYEERKSRIKADYKPHWRELFQRQRDDLKRYDSDFGRRLKFALNETEDGKILSVARAVFNDGVNRKAFIEKQEAERKALSDHQKAKTREEWERTRDEWQKSKQAIKAEFEVSRKARLEQSKALSDQIWKGDKAREEERARLRLKEAQEREIERIEEQERNRARGRRRRPR